MGCVSAAGHMQIGCLFYLYFQRVIIMTIFSDHKQPILISLVLLVGSHASNVLADNGSYNQAPSGYNYGGYPAPQNYGYNQSGNYMPNNNSWGNPGSGFTTPWNNNGSGFNNPWNNRNSGFSGPWNNRGSSFSSPWNNRGSSFGGPWNNGGWGNGNNGGWGNGGRNPFGPRSPDQWMNPNKNNLSNNWDDAINAPSRMGRMPGGWSAPSVNMTNPIDVGDEFSDAARDVPDQMNNFQYRR